MNLITEDDLKHIRNNYNGVDGSLSENLKELQSILDRMSNKDAKIEKFTNFKVDLIF